MTAAAKLQHCGFLLLTFSALIHRVLAQSSAAQTKTLQPLQPVLFRITTVSKQANNQTIDPDLTITFQVQTGGHAGMYCNPDWLQAGLPTAYNAVYQTDNTKGKNIIQISREDSQYRPSGNTTSLYQPSFICAIISMEAARQIDVSFQYNATYSSPVLVQNEQNTIQTIYNQCCGVANDMTRCAAWKAMNNGSTVFTNFCSFQNQDCTDRGNLITLDLTGFGLVCAFPSQAIQNFTQLEYLAVSKNPGMTGNMAGILQGLSNLPNLLEVYLQDNTGLYGQLSTGPGQGACALPPSLELLEAQNTSLTGRLPDCLFGNSSIYNLLLSNNQLTGTIPNSITDGSYLQILQLANNKLSGPIPSTLGNAGGLYALDLSYNGLTGTMPGNLGSLPFIQSIDVRYNSLSGTIPGNLVDNPNLQLLYLLNNNFTALDSNWMNAQSSLANSTMFLIAMDANQIKGPFPNATKYMKNLRLLSLDLNNFTGTLPSDSGIFPNLLAFNVSHNNFSGTIPSNLGKLPGFQGVSGLSVGLNTLFDVSYNQLSGPLPSFLNNGSVPQSLQSNVAIAGNNFTSYCGNSTFQYIQDFQKQCNRLSAPAPAPAAAAPSNSSTSSGLKPATAPSPAARVPSVAPAAQPPSILRAITPQAKSSGLSGGAVAGIVIGVLLAVAVGIAAAVLFTSRSKRESAMSAISGRPRSGFGSAVRKGLDRRHSNAPFLQSNGLGFARFSDNDMIGDEAPR